MSGGGSAPSAPNLSANIGNANASYGTATSNAAQTMNTAQAYNQNAQNTLSSVNGSMTPMMSQVNSTANANMNQYQNEFMPLQQQQVQQAQNYGSAANVAELQGQAVANSNSSLQAQLNNQRQQLASEGVDPASVHGAALNQQAAVQGAAQNAQAATNSALNTQQTAIGLTNQANQMGLQVGQQGTNQAATGAQIGSQEVSNQNQTNSTGVNNLTAANTYLNTGVNANSSAGQIAGQQFQDQLGAFQAQQQANSSMMSGIGSIAGAAAMFMEKGGVVPGAKNGLMAVRTPAVAPFSGGGVLPRQLPNNYAAGGSVSARGALPISPIPGSTDTKPAMLTPGEFVLPHDVAAWRGHAHWYKEMDKARAEMSQRHGLPMPPGAAMTARGH